MLIQLLEDVFKALPNSDLSVKLLGISKGESWSYCAKEVRFDENDIKDFAKEIEERYVGKDSGTTRKDGKLKSFENVEKYNGSTNENIINKFSGQDKIIASDHKNLLKAINDSSKNDEIKVEKCKWDAYVLTGRVCLHQASSEKSSVILVSMRTPITVLKNKFLEAEGEMKKIKSLVLSLNSSIDIVMVKRSDSPWDIYMLSLAGEALYNMERTCKIVCEEQSQKAANYGIMNAPEMFLKIAGKGFNPRRFLAFNEDSLKKLKTATFRSKVAKQFNIKLDKDKFDTREEEDVSKLIKLMCDRGMVSPFDDCAREVSGARNWK